MIMSDDEKSLLVMLSWMFAVIKITCIIRRSNVKFPYPGSVCDSTCPGSVCDSTCTCPGSVCDSTRTYIFVGGSDNI